MNTTENLIVIDSAGNSAPTGTTSMPLIRTGNWGWAVESCALRGEVAQAVKAVFNTLPENYQLAFTFTSKPGEWFTRARVWARLLRPALPDNLYNQARLSLTALLESGWPGPNPTGTQTNGNRP